VLPFWQFYRHLSSWTKIHNVIASSSRSNRLVSIFPRAIASQSPITSEMRSLFSHYQCDRIQWTFHHRSSRHKKAIAFSISKRAIALPTKTRSHTADVSPSLISPYKSESHPVDASPSLISPEKIDRYPVKRKRSPFCNYQEVRSHLNLKSSKQTPGADLLRKNFSHCPIRELLYHRARNNSPA
jgi:hypothetical protein